MTADRAGSLRSFPGGNRGRAPRARAGPRGCGVAAAPGGAGREVPAGSRGYAQTYHGAAGSARPRVQVQRARAAAGLSEVWGPREAARIVRAWARLPQPHIPHFVVSRLHELLERSSCVVIGERPGGKRGGSWGLDFSPRGAWSPAPRPVGCSQVPRAPAASSNPWWLVGAPSVGCPLYPLGWGLLPGGCQLSPSQGSVSGTRCLGEHMGGRLRWAQAPSHSHGLGHVCK